MSKTTVWKSVLVFVLFAGMKSTASAQSAGDFGLGVLVMVGARYDNLRMCVASPAGVKGGPIADIMLTGRYAVNDRSGIGINLPVMRPLLFAIAFKMLQFEPEVQIDFRIPTGNDKVDFVAAPSLGASFHYGPDYKSDTKNRSPSFFAAGPIVGVHAGVGLKDDSGEMKNFIGIKPFYAALFSHEHGAGTVLGGALEYGRTF